VTRIAPTTLPSPSALFGCDVCITLRCSGQNGKSGEVDRYSNIDHLPLLYPPSPAAKPKHIDSLILLLDKTCSLNTLSLGHSGWLGHRKLVSRYRSEDRWDLVLRRCTSQPTFGRDMKRREHICSLNF